MARIRVMIVEDQPNILKSQLKLLQERPEIEIVGTALSGEAALEDIDRIRPEVVLCDLGLPRMSGIDLTKAIKARNPKIEVLIFTIFDEEDKVLQAVKAGASGYLLKGAQVDKIVDAIKDVNDGGSVIQPNLARRLLKAFHVGEDGSPETHLNAPSTPPGQAATGVPQRSGLTVREIEILRLIAKGLSNNEAAQVLTLSRATIRTHLEHIYQKLEVTNRVEAVTEGIRKGIIVVD